MEFIKVRFIQVQHHRVKGKNYAVVQKVNIKVNKCMVKVRKSNQFRSRVMGSGKFSVQGPSTGNTSVGWTD